MQCRGGAWLKTQIHLQCGSALGVKDVTDIYLDVLREDILRNA